MERRKFIVALSGLASLALVPLGCGGDRVFANNPTPTPTPSPVPTLTPKDGENAIETALLDVCSKFGFEPLRMGGIILYAVYGASGGLAAESMAVMLREGKGTIPANYLNGGDVGRPYAPASFKITNMGNGWAHVSVVWTKDMEYSGDVAWYIAHVKQLFEEAAETLAHTV